MNFHPAKNTRSPPNTHSKEIQVIGLTIRLNINKETPSASEDKTEKNRRKSGSSSSPAHLSKNKEKHVSYKEEIPEIKINFSPSNKDSTVNLKDDDSNQTTSYLLFPTNFNIKIVSRLDFSDNTNNIPYQSINIDLNDPITFLLSPEQIKFIEALNSHIQNLTKIHKNIHLRPIKRLKDDVKGWWRYAIRAVTEKCERDQVYKKSWSLIKMRKYISLYKRHQHIVSTNSLSSISKIRSMFHGLLDLVPMKNNC